MLRAIGLGSRMTHREVFRAGNIGAEPSANYQRALFVLDNVVRECITVSRHYGGLEAATQKHFYASVLFTAMLSRSVSLLMLAPHSPWASKMIEHWDYASAAVILRTMMELRAAFHYLCVDECTDEEWDCRWNLLNLHDCNSRKRLFEAREPVDPEQVAGLQAQTEEIRNRLKANAHFQTLRHQTRLLNGQAAYLFPMEEMMERAGHDKPTYRFLNILFSSHVHGLPMSYYRMGMQERGRGLPSPIEEGYTTICLSLASALLTATRDEVHELFRGLPPVQTPAPGARAYPSKVSSTFEHESGSSVAPSDVAGEKFGLWSEIATRRMTQSDRSKCDPLDRLSRLGDHVALREPGRRHGRWRLAAEAWPRTI